MALSSKAPPLARVWPFTTSVSDTMYMWGGRGDTEPGVVFIHCRGGEEIWMREHTRGQHPPAGLRDGGCCISGQHLYLYGGLDKGSHHGVLYELNTNSWTWRKLSDGGPEGPGKKSGCRIIPYQDQLLVVGGEYGEMLGSRQAGASYESGLTNEVHCFTLTTGKHDSYI